MKKEHAQLFRRIYGTLTGAAAVIAGICLMIACLDIYRSGGDQIFTPEKVAQAFAPIAVPVYLCLALAVGGFLLELVLPAESKKRKAVKNLQATLDRLMEKRDLDNCDESLKQAILSQRASRKRDWLISLFVLAVCSIGFLVYALNPAHFHQSQINESMVKAVAILFVCLAAPFGCALGAAYRAKASLQKEIDLVKEIEAGAKKEKAAPCKSCDKGVLAVRCVLVCAAVVLLVYGYLAGGTADVLTKAINICTECVGLG